MSQRIQLGQQVRDQVTGWQGIATQRMENLDGTCYIFVTPPVETNGKLRKAKFCNEAQLQVIGQGITGNIEHSGQRYQQPSAQQ